MAALPPHSPGASAVGAATLDIIDSGCGTGYYLGEALRSRPGSRALALDASVDAVALTVAASRGLGDLTGLVADIWKPLPVRAGSADVVLCVFAPRNADEFARVLRADGSLIVVTPRAAHLAELRDAGTMLDIQADKLEHLDARLGERFTLLRREAVEYERALDGATQRLVAAMGPAGHHDRPDSPTAPVAGHITIAVDVSTYAPR